MTRRTPPHTVARVDIDSAASKSLQLNETGIWRRENGEEFLNLGPLNRAIEFLTEGRSQAAPELSILAIEVLESIITGRRAAILKDVYDKTRVTPRTMARIHVRFAAGRSVLGSDSKLAPMPATAATADVLRLDLASEDARFRTLADAELIDAIHEARAGNESNLSKICARLSLACGAFDDVQKPGEEFADALDRVRLAYANAGPRAKAKSPKKRKSKRKKR